MDMDTEQGTALLTWERPRDVAQRLGYTESYVYKLIRRGKLRVLPTRFGRLVDPESIERYRASLNQSQRISRCA